MVSLSLSTACPNVLGEAAAAAEKKRPREKGERKTRFPPFSGAGWKKSRGKNH